MFMGWVAGVDVGVDSGASLTIQKSFLPLFSVRSPLVDQASPATIYPLSDVCLMENPLSADVPPSAFCQSSSPPLIT